LTSSATGPSEIVVARTNAATLFASATSSGSATAGTRSFLHFAATASARAFRAVPDGDGSSAAREFETDRASRAARRARDDRDAASSSLGSSHRGIIDAARQ